MYSESREAGGYRLLTFIVIILAYIIFSQQKNVEGASEKRCCVLLNPILKLRKQTTVEALPGEAVPGGPSALHALICNQIIRILLES